MSSHAQGLAVLAWTKAGWSGLGAAPDVSGSIGFGAPVRLVNLAGDLIQIGADGVAHALTPAASALSVQPATERLPG